HTPAWSRETGDKPGADKIVRRRDNRDRGCLQRDLRRQIASRVDDAHFQLGQLARERTQALGRFRVSDIDGDVLSLDVAGLAQALPKPLHPGTRRGGVARPEDTDPVEFCHGWDLRSKWFGDDTKAKRG